VLKRKHRPREIKCGLMVAACIWLLINDCHVKRSSPVMSSEFEACLRMPSLTFTSYALIVFALHDIGKTFDSRFRKCAKRMRRLNSF
jgi:hypothetical protein